MTTRPVLPRWQFMNGNGQPLAGGKLFWYATGTTTPVTTYADAGLTVPNPNPLILNAAGYAPDIFLPPGEFKAILKDASDVTIWTADPVTGFGADDDDDALYAVTFGVKGDGTTDDTAALNAFAAACANKVGVIGTGTYRTTAPIVFPNTIKGLTMRGTISADHAGIGMLFGASGVRTERARFIGLSVTKASQSDWTNAGSIGIRLVNPNACSIDVSYANGFTTGVQFVGDAQACARNVVTLGALTNGKQQVDLHALDHTGFPNQNAFLGGSLAVDSGVNASLTRYGVLFSAATIFSGTFTADPANERLTLSGTPTLATGVPCLLSSTGTLPAPLASGVVYFARAVAANQIELSTSSGGSAINITDAGTGTHSLIATGYRTHNNNIFINTSFELKKPGSAEAYAVRCEVDAANNTFQSARDEGNSSSPIEHVAGGGQNLFEQAFTDQGYLSTIRYPTGATRAAWALDRNRFQRTTANSQRVIASVPDVVATAFTDSVSGALVGIDGLGVMRNTSKTVGTNWTTHVARSDTSLTIGASAVTLGNQRAVGVMVMADLVKDWAILWSVVGNSGGRIIVWGYDASGNLLDMSATPVLAGVNALTYSATGHFWWQQSDASHAAQTKRQHVSLPEAVKMAFLGVARGSADFDLTAFGVSTYEAERPRAWKGWTGTGGILLGSATYDPPNLADGAGATTTVTVTNAELGDYVEAVSFSQDMQGISVTGYVSASNTVAVRFQNESGGALDLASGTLRARVRKA